MYWGLWVYVGSNAKEVADCDGRRSFRYKGGNAEETKAKKGKAEKSRKVTKVGTGKKATKAETGANGKKRKGKK